MYNCSTQTRYETVPTVFKGNLKEKSKEIQSFRLSGTFLPLAYTYESDSHPVSFNTPLSSIRGADLSAKPSQVQCAISIRITVVGYVWTLARPQLLQIDDYTVCRLLAFLYHSLAVLTFGVSVWDKDCTGRWRHFPLMILSGWTSCSGVHGAIKVAFFFFLMLCNCHCADNKRDLRH